MMCHLEMSKEAYDAMNNAEIKIAFAKCNHENIGRCRRDIPIAVLLMLMLMLMHFFSLCVI